MLSSHHLLIARIIYSGIHFVALAVTSLPPSEKLPYPLTRPPPPSSMSRTPPYPIAPFPISAEYCKRFLL